jgi:4-hydroxy 2-oxovalerate aldolase
MTDCILDCTLRDGAHVNKGKFGIKIANAIVTELVNSGVKMVELGFLEPGSASPGTTFFDSINACEEFYAEQPKQSGSEFGLMLRTDRCPIEAIKKNSFIQFIRIAFYPEHLIETQKYLNVASELGFKTYANLISITRYSESEIRNILSQLNDTPVRGVSIVDTYGSLDRKNIRSYIDLFDESLNPGIALGLHLHENISESTSMIDEFHSTNIDRIKIYDGALGGMGRIPGNIPTELIANYLNKHNSCKFNVDLLLRAAAKHIYPFKKINPWGYLPIYAYSAIKKIDRTYPEYFEACGLSDVENMYCQDFVAGQFEKSQFCEVVAIQAIKNCGFEPDICR